MGWRLCACVASGPDEPEDSTVALWYHPQGTAGAGKFVASQPKSLQPTGEKEVEDFGRQHRYERLFGDHASSSSCSVLETPHAFDGAADQADPTESNGILASLKQAMRRRTHEPQHRRWSFPVELRKRISVDTSTSDEMTDVGAGESITTAATPESQPLSFGHASSEEGRSSESKYVSLIDLLAERKDARPESVTITVDMGA